MTINLRGAIFYEYDQPRSAVFIYIQVLYVLVGGYRNKSGKYDVNCIAFTSFPKRKTNEYKCMQSVIKENTAKGDCL